MACEIPFGTFWHTLAALDLGEPEVSSHGMRASAYPADENILGQSSVGVLDFDKCELNPTIREIFNQVHQFPRWANASIKSAPETSAAQMDGGKAHRQCFVP